MDFRYFGKNMELTNSLKEYTTDKLMKFFVGHNVKPLKTTEVELGKDSQHHHSGNIFRAEIMVHLSGKTLRVEQTAETVLAAFDLCIPKLKIMLEKHKDKNNK